MEKDHIVYKAKEVICLHCGEKQSLTSANYAEWLDECVLFREEHKSCRKQELGKMTFEEWFEKWWGERTGGPYKSINVESIARAAWEAALEAKKEAIYLVDAWECDGCREIYDTEDYALSCCGLNHHTTTDAFKCPRCGELGRDESDMEGHWC